ncbi:arginine--tRNA ligase, chloroplastic/mitochondrial [Tanacetum coccineum]
MENLRGRMEQVLMKRVLTHNHLPDLMEPQKLTRIGVILRLKVVLVAMKCYCCIVAGNTRIPALYHMRSRIIKLNFMLKFFMSQMQVPQMRNIVSRIAITEKTTKEFMEKIDDEYRVKMRHHSQPLDTVQHHFSATMGQEFDAWLKEAVIDGRYQDVNDYKEKALHGTLAYPWPDQDLNYYSHRVHVLKTLDALVAAWLPGAEGNGITDVIFGDYEFHGRLPVSWFKTVDQLSMNTHPNEYDLLFPLGDNKTDIFLPIFDAIQLDAANASLEVVFRTETLGRKVRGYVLAYYGDDFLYKCYCHVAKDVYSAVLFLTDHVLNPGKLQLIKSVMAVPTKGNLIIEAYLEDAGSGEVIMKNSCKFKPQLKNCNSFGTTTMFYVNSSSGNTLEPKPTKAASETTTLIGLLQKISSKFKKGE